MAADRIEREITVNAPQERVWAVLTEAEHIARWFGDSAQVDLRPGGQMAFGWTQDNSPDHRAVIERVEPPSFFSYRWARRSGEDPVEGNSTLVEFSLSADGAATRLRVVETGFASLAVSEDEQGTAVKENTEGWISELRDLQEYAERVSS